MDTGSMILRRSCTSDVKDHLGKAYNSLYEMCNVYGISIDAYKNRISSGYTIGEALTVPLRSCGTPSECTDHLGNKYKSISDMVRAYGIPRQTYTSRINHGWTLEQALTAEPEKGWKSELGGLPAENYSVRDHLGNVYSSLDEMLEQYGITSGRYYRRIKAGWSLKDTLEIKVNPTAEDHKGRKFKNEREMCEAYGISHNTYRARLKRGYSKEKALTMATQKQSGTLYMVKDHNGKEYRNTAEMCKAYGVKYGTFISRRRNGMGLKDALTLKAEKHGGEAEDHLGNRYNSIYEMCTVYEISRDVFKQRIKTGWTVKRALTTPVTAACGIICTDHLGREYSSVSAMAQEYGIRRQTLISRLKNGWSLADALTKEVMDMGMQYKDHLGNVHSNLSEMCAAHGVTVASYKKKAEKGLSVKECLTADNIWEDHLGNRYKSCSEMCRAYSINVYTFKGRLKAGWNLEEALTVKAGEKRKMKDTENIVEESMESTESMETESEVSVKAEERVKAKAESSSEKNNSIEKRTDHTGKVYKTVKEMCSAWDVKYSAYKQKIAAGVSKEEALKSSKYRRNRARK